jgi:hypothetical protein
MGEQVWRESGIGGPDDIEQLQARITTLERQVVGLELKLPDRDDDLAAARGQLRARGPAQPRTRRAHASRVKQQVTGPLSKRTPCGWRTLETEAAMPNKGPRGPQPHWRPKRETLRVLTAVDAILVRYRDHLPVSLRQMFYVLLSDGVLAKTEREYKRMCEYAGMARRSGRIPWDAIRDDTQIAVEAPPSFAGPGDFFRAVEAAVDD